MWLENLAVRFLNATTRKPKRNAAYGVPLGQSFGSHDESGVAVWPEARLCEHMLVVGKTGSGKSHALLHLACEHMRAGRGFVFLDPHGDASIALSRLAAVFPDARQRLMLVDPTDAQQSPGLNPLEVQGEGERGIFVRSSEVASILRKRWGADWPGARSEELLRACVYTLAANDLTLAEIPLLLTRADVREGLVGRLRSSDIREYWLERFEPLSEAQKAQYREPILTRASAFLMDPLVRHFIGQRRSTIDFRHAMDEGRWVVVNLAKGILREHSATLGNLLFARLQFDVFARVRTRPDARRVFGIIADEVQNFQDNDVSVILTEGRKMAVSTVVSTQTLNAVPPALRGALLNAGAHLVFRVGFDDASALAAEISGNARKRYTAELMGLARGEAIVRIGAEAPQHIRIPHLPQVTPAQREEARLLASLSRRLYSRDRRDVEREIEGRRGNAVPRVNSTADEPHPEEG